MMVMMRMKMLMVMVMNIMGAGGEHHLLLYVPPCWVHQKFLHRIWTKKLAI
jgi:hypothetical protein